MATLVTDPQLEEQLLAQRRAWGADHHDEVWEGTYIMTPLPNDDHQEFVSRLGHVLETVIGDEGLGRVRPGVNLTDRRDNWTHNYRCPDVVVFLNDTKATNYGSYWQGPADFLVEIVSPGDLTYEKLPFYQGLGVREVFIIDRDPWKLELYRHDGVGLTLVGRSSAESDAILASAVVPLQFRLVPGQPRPRIQVAHPESGRHWDI
jgi:Uma2 family endonuclease